VLLGATSGGATSGGGGLATVLGLVLLAILASVAIVVYFLPTILVRTLDYPVRRRVFWLNLLLGWTVVGWVVVLRMAWREENRALLEALGVGRRARGRFSRASVARPAGSAGVAPAAQWSGAQPAAGDGERAGDPGHPVAGWYDDPLGDGERWWDGNAWTEQVRPRGM